MKAFLLYRNRDFDLKQNMPWNEASLNQDLELPILFKAMADKDEFLHEVAQKIVLSGLKNDLDTVQYRQDILKDCMQNPAIVRYLYDTAVGAIESRKNNFFSIFTTHPPSILSSSIRMMQIYVRILKELRKTADEQVGHFVSEGFIRFFTMLQQELGDAYFNEIEEHLEALKFRNGILTRAQLGEGNKGINYTLRKLQLKNKNWLQRIFQTKPPGYFFDIHPRDESGLRALSVLKDKSLNLVANALAQSTDHILSFFNMMRAELAFYVGCLNLQERLDEIGGVYSFPCPTPFDKGSCSFKGLYDACLALSMQQKVVGNDLNADHKNPIIITGANQGGKSTFLRSIGLSQLMMQCGMFLPADSFSADLCSSLFTHFKREEDTSMKSGKFDEELSRMNDIADHITPHSLLLFNESFAATNEREGSEIARQIVDALIEKDLKVFFVSHLYEFTHGFYKKKQQESIFLRAERQDDTSRTFKLTEGEPLPTSYGIDIFNEIFGHGERN